MGFAILYVFFMRNFPKLSSNSLDMLVKRMHKKASQSISRYRISAVAFDKNGEFIAQSFNNVPMEGVEPKHGAGIHAEAKLMRKYGTKVKTILISRVGHGGEWRPIKPCEKCQALASKLGVKIITIAECRESAFEQ